MNVISVNVGTPRIIPYRDKDVATGIYKDPVAGRVPLRALNLDGDGQADLVAHGGPYKAVYGYPHEHYATWMAEEDRDDYVHGQFGENLTTSGLLEDTAFVGNVYRVGSAMLQITQPRVPCFKLGIRMGDPTFVKRFMQAQRTGFYFRVLEEGDVAAGDAISLERADPQGLSVRAIFNLYYVDQDPALLEKAVQIEGLAPGWVAGFSEMLAG